MRHSRRVLLISPKAPPYGGMALQASLLQDLLTRDGVTVTFLASNLPFPASLRFCERLRGVRPFLRSAVFCWRLWQLIPEIDVVHILACSWLYFLVVVCPAVLLGRIRGKRVVLNYRGGEADAFFRLHRFWVRPFFYLADVVTAPSDFLVQVIGRRIGTPVEIVPNIVDLGRFRFRKRDPLRPTMVVTRHLEKLYGVDAVIRAFAVIQERHKGATLHIAGTGSEENNLRSLVEELKLKNVVFHGYVHGDQLPSLYDRCDILLNASRADNFPASLVEGAAAGLVVISTAVGGIPFIFQHEATALLASAEDWRVIAENVCRLLEDPDLASRLAAQAFERCRQYEWESVRESLYRTYCFSNATQSATHPATSPAVTAGSGLARGTN